MHDQRGISRHFLPIRRAFLTLWAETDPVQSQNKLSASVGAEFKDQKELAIFDQKRFTNFSQTPQTCLCRSDFLTCLIDAQRKILSTSGHLRKSVLDDIQLHLQLFYGWVL